MEKIDKKTKLFDEIVELVKQLERKKKEFEEELLKEMWDRK